MRQKLAVVKSQKEDVPLRCMQSMRASHERAGRAINPAGGRGAWRRAARPPRSGTPGTGSPRAGPAASRQPRRRRRPRKGKPRRAPRADPAPPSPCRRRPAPCAAPGPGRSRAARLVAAPRLAARSAEVGQRAELRDGVGEAALERVGGRARRSRGAVAAAAAAEVNREGKKYAAVSRYRG